MSYRGQLLSPGLTGVSSAVSRSWVDSYTYIDWRTSGWKITIREDWVCLQVASVLPTESSILLGVEVLSLQTARHHSCHCYWSEY